MIVKYTDGMEIDDSGEYRVIRNSDGLYVVGHGMICPVSSPAEGDELITKLKSGKEANAGS